MKWGQKKKSLILQLMYTTKREAGNYFGTKD